ncbi:MAG TPA: prolyl oligopeptidase family serine peptidase [archaeon]|nr:prolyl oligopeptidase family serine peptidase [archaeon]
MWKNIFTAISIVFLLCESNNIEARENSLIQVEIKSIDLPTFRTGEKGPLLGRVVLRLDSKLVQPVNGQAAFEIEELNFSGQGTVQQLYPGIYAALDFPIELENPPEENSVLDGVLKVKIGEDCSLSQRVFVFIREWGMFFRTYRSTLDDAVYPFALYHPEGVEKVKNTGWPLVLSLHGAWSNYANNLKRLFGIGNRPGEPDELAFCSLPIWPELPQAPGIVVCPWGRGTMGYHGPGARDVLDVLEIVRENYPVDPERITVTGLSMGGNGTWEMVLRHPDLFAAAVPVCPFSDIENWDLFQELRPENSNKYPFLKKTLAQNQIANWADNTIHIPVQIYHGNDDPSVPVSHSEQMLSALQNAGAMVLLTRFDNVGHNAWDPTYKEGRTLHRLFEAYRRKPEREITFTTCRYENDRYDWLQIERFERYGDYAKIKALWNKGADEVVLKTENVSRLNLYLQSLPGVRPGTKVKISGGQSDKGIFMSVPDQGPMRLEIKKGRISAAPGPAPGGPVKRKGLEGPIYEALSSRVILVYGTIAEGVSTLEQTLRFACWGELPDVHFMIKPDSLVTAQDIKTSHLVLFGDERTNSLVARINPKSPVRFDGRLIVAGKESFPREEVAFKCVFPNPLNPDKLVLVNFEEEWDYSVPWFYLAAFKQLPDYIIYRRGADRPFKSEVLKAGFFNEEWSW